jgi:hypothetical protein
MTSSGMLRISSGVRIASFIAGKDCIKINPFSLSA